MSAKTFYSCVGVFGVAGIVMAIANINNQSYTGRCWFMGGTALFVLTVVVLLIVLGLRKRTFSGRNYVKRMSLAHLAIDDAKRITVRYVEGGRVVTESLNQSVVDVVVDENSENDRVAILKIDGLEKTYSYRFWFIKWPEKTIVTETYTLLISRPLDEILDFYATRARR